MPTFNVAPYIERTILSAAGQTFRDIEIIVVDDGSTDATVGIVQGLTRRLPNLRLLERRHRGVSHARNDGTRAAVGEYVAYLDGDDLWHPTKIEKQLAALQAFGGDPDWVAAYAFYRWIREDDTLILDGPMNTARGYCFASHLSINHVANGSNLLVRRDAVLAVDGFDPSLSHCEDYDLQLKLLRRGKIERVPEFLVGYRRRPNSASTRFVEAADALFDLADRHLGDPILPPQAIRQARTATHRHAWYQYMKGGALGRGMRSYLAFLGAEPVEAVLDLALRVARSALQGLEWALPRRGRTGPDRLAVFQDLEPTRSVSLDLHGKGLHVSARFEQWRTARISARLQALDDICHARLEREMEAASAAASDASSVLRQGGVAARR